MKKTLVAAIIGLAATASVMAQGRILLDTATSPAPYPYITYGAGSGGTLGAFIPQSAGYTVGFYFSSVANTFTDPSGTGTPDGTWTLATGSGSTAQMSSFDGLFFGAGDFTLPTANSTVWLVITAYNGASYATSGVRGHSAVFTIAPNTTLNGGGTPTYMPSGFSVQAVPEPSTFALAGLGLAGLLIFRRRK